MLPSAWVASTKPEAGMDCWEVHLKTLQARDGSVELLEARTRGQAVVGRLAVGIGQLPELLAERLPHGARARVEDQAA